MQEYLRTVSGIEVYFNDPKPEQINILDIAWNLSAICRFQGGMLKHYSVAEHSILGSDMATCLKFAREFMVHDMSEYIFGDPPAPLKPYFPDYSNASHKFQEFLNMHFLGYPVLEDQVGIIDKRMCATECRDLRVDGYKDIKAEPYTTCDFKNYSHLTAFFSFIRRFNTLFQEYKSTCYPKIDLLSYANQELLVRN